MNTQSRTRTGVGVTGYEEGARAFMSNSLKYMGLGLLLTALTSYVTQGYIPVVDGVPQVSNWFFALMITELALVVAISGIALRASGTVAFVLFLAYSALNGITLTPLLMQYTTASLTNTFLVTAIMFGGAGIYGSVTRRSLEGFGSYALMALWGLIAAMVVNLFIGSTMFEFAISVAGVLLFVGLTAYDFQKLEALYNERAAASSDGLAIYGALTLYLDALNLFLFLLRFVGVRK